MTRRLVLDLRAQRPVWHVSPDVVAALRRALGTEWELVEVEAPVSSDGDGGVGSQEAITASRGAEIYAGFGIPVGVVTAGRGTLRWAHSCTAGIGASLTSGADGRVRTSSLGLRVSHSKARL